ncbi:hypothetical protein, partial [Mesorhizobium sp. M0870]|uniref:hypothetical protein n=1 Tax=Mesorhizobium sp. M0870 TaxID=2957016 RepID=UPI0033369FE0
GIRLSSRLGHLGLKTRLAIACLPTTNLSTMLRINAWMRISYHACLRNHEQHLPQGAKRITWEDHSLTIPHCELDSGHPIFSCSTKHNARSRPVCAAEYTFVLAGIRSVRNRLADIRHAHFRTKGEIHISKRASNRGARNLPCRIIPASTIDTAFDFDYGRHPTTAGELAEVAGQKERNLGPRERRSDAGSF